MEKLKKVIRLLEETGQLPSEYKPHKLSGQYAGSWECHIMSDWLLDDIRHGRVTEYKSSDDMFEKLGI